MQRFRSVRFSASAARLRVDMPKASSFDPEPSFPCQPSNIALRLIIAGDGMDPFGEVPGPFMASDNRRCCNLFDTTGESSCDPARRAPADATSVNRTTNFRSGRDTSTGTGTGTGTERDNAARTRP